MVTDFYYLVTSIPVRAAVIAVSSPSVIIGIRHSMRCSSSMYYLLHIIVHTHTCKSHYTGVFDLNFKLSLKRRHAHVKRIYTAAHDGFGRPRVLCVGGRISISGRNSVPDGNYNVHEYWTWKTNAMRYYYIIIIIIFPSRQLNCVSCRTAATAGLCRWIL